MAISDAALLQHLAALVLTILPDERIARGCNLMSTFTNGGFLGPCDQVTAGEEPVVVEGTGLVRIGVAEVVASLLDSTKCLADRTVRDLVVGVNQLICLWVALPHCVVLAALGQGDILGEGGGVGQAGHSQQRNQPQHI